MGFTLRHDPTKTPPKSTQLQASMKFCSSGASLCGKISSRAAAAIMPMTAGRMPRMAPSTSRLFFRRMKKRATRIMSVSDGRHTAKVAIIDPRIPNHSLPASTPTEYPT